MKLESCFLGGLDGLEQKNDLTRLLIYCGHLLVTASTVLRGVVRVNDLSLSFRERSNIHLK